MNILINKNSGIYKITNKINNMIYIGSAVNLKKRCLEHINRLTKGINSNPKFLAAWKKYGAENFEITILELVENKEKLIEREQFWLDNLCPYKRNIGYNICFKAGSTLGFKHTEENKLHLSKIAKERKINVGIKRSEETRKKISESRKGKYTGIENGFFGKHHTQETLEKLAKNRPSMEGENNPRFGVVLTEETKQKISLALTGKKTGPKTEDTLNKIRKKVIQLDKKNNIIKYWDSITDAVNILKICGPNVSECLKGKRKSAGGFIWKYDNQK